MTDDTLTAYNDFTKWCRDSPHLNLDSRPHTHGGAIGDGGYISDEKTRIAFSAWRAAIKDDRQRRSEPVDWKDGYRAAMNEAGWAVRELYVNHVHHTGVDGLLKRCQELEQSFIRSAEAAPQPDHIPDAGKMVVSDRSMKEIKAALAGAKGKEHTLIFSAKEVRSLLNTIVNQNQRIERFEKKIADHVAQHRKMVPEGFKLVPVEPTYDMTQAGVNLALSARISGAYPWPTYIRDMYKAMLAAAPRPDHIPDVTKMVEPTLTPKQIAYRLAEYAAEYAAQLRKPAFGEEDPAHYELSNLIDRSRYRIMPGPDPLFLIEKAMRGEE